MASLVTPSTTAMASTPTTYATTKIGIVTSTAPRGISRDEVRKRRKIGGEYAGPKEKSRQTHDPNTGGTGESLYSLK